MRTTLKLVISLTLLLAAGLAVAEPPPPMVVKREAGSVHQENGQVPLEPLYIPIRLLQKPYGDFSVEEKQAVPSKFYEEFWLSVESHQAKGQDPRCLPPVIADYIEATGTTSIPAGSRTAADVVRSFPVGIVGGKIYEEPIWNTLHRRVETLVYLQLSQVVRNISTTALEAGDVITFVLHHGSAKVAGKTLCSAEDRRSISNPADGQMVDENKKFFLVGFLRSYEDRFLETNDSYHFRVVGNLIYPPSGIPMFSSVPVTLTKLSQSLDE